MGISTVVIMLAILVFSWQIHQHLSSNINFILHTEPQLSESVELPLKKKFANKSILKEGVMISANLQYNGKQSTSYSVTTNACIVAITINSKEFTHNKIKREPCLNKRFNVNFKNYLQSGNNTLSILLYSRHSNTLKFNAAAILSPQYMWLSYLVAGLIVTWACIVLGLTLYQYRKTCSTNCASPIIHSSTSVSASRINHKTIFILLVISVVGLLVRTNFLPIVSADMGWILTRWYKHFQEQGLDAFSQIFYNYTPAYLYLMALMNWALPSLQAIHAIKFISIIFDYLLAFVGFLMLRAYVPHKPWLAILTYAALIFSPKVIMNSAIWGQCDVIYTFALVACVYFIGKYRPFIATTCWAIACCFKMQAVFFTPFIFLMIVKQRIPWFALLLLPVCYLISIMPAALKGADFMHLLTMYPIQHNVFRALSVTAGNLYIFINPAYYQMLLPIVMAFAFGVMALLCSIAIHFQKKWDLPTIFLLATLVMLLAAYFLPKMHERYFYPAVIFSILLAATRWRFIPAAICLNMVAFFYQVNWAPHLFELTQRTRLEIGFVLNTLALLQLIGLWGWDLYKQHKSTTLPR